MTKESTTPHPNSSPRYATNAQNNNSNAPAGTPQGNQSGHTHTTARKETPLMTTNLNTTKTEPIPTINIYTPTGEHIANQITYALNKHANN